MTSLSAVVVAANVLAETTDPEEQSTLINNALPIAGLFVLILLIAIYFLWRSMKKQVAKIDPSLPLGRDDRQQALDRRLTAEAVEKGEQADDGSA